MPASSRYRAPPALAVLILISAQFTLAQANSSPLPDVSALGSTAPSVTQAAPRAASADDTLVIVEGDILTHAAQRQHLRGIQVGPHLRPWAYGIVPYRIDASLPIEGVIEVSAAIRAWNDNTGVSLIPAEWLPRAEGADHLVFTKGPGCASWMGRQGGAQEVWVAPNCHRGSVMHEIGHALGLQHEHTRADRDQFIAIHWPNIQPDKAHNFDRVDDQDAQLGPYDYASIMHYGPQFFSRNGQITIEPLLPTEARLGQREALSAGDVAAIRQIYGTDLALSIEQTRTADNHPSMSLYVSNLGPRGAHALELLIPVEAPMLVEQSDSPWQCVLEPGPRVRCQLSRLASGAQESIQLVLRPMDTMDEEGSNDLESLAGTDRASGSADAQPVDVSSILLQSATPDTDLSNNGGGVGRVEPLPLLSQALGDDSGGSTNSSVGLGSTNVLVVLGAAWWGFRRRRNRPELTY